MQAEFTDPNPDREGKFLITYDCDGYHSHIHKNLRFARFSFLTNIHSITLLVLMEGKQMGETCIIDLDTMEILDRFVTTKAYRGKLGR